MVRSVIRPIMLLAAVLVALPALSAPASDRVEHGRDVMLEAQVEPGQGYVLAQAVYRLRFYQAIDVRDLVITGPTARLADLRTIGADRVYEAQRDGRRYRVHERSYAVFPFASGPLELGGASAVGRVVASAQKSGDGRRAIKIEAPPQTLTVLPAPASVGTSFWLPARSLKLGENWSPAPGAARLGEALRRSIRIEAAGIDAAQLPELHIEVPGMTAYAEPARVENRFDGELNIGLREQTFLMIPQRAGEIVVPDLRLDWWNTGTAAPASAILPGSKLRVAADVSSVLTAPLAQGAAPVQLTGIQTDIPAPSRNPLIIAIGIFCMAVVLAWFNRADVRSRWQLLRACRSGNAAAVRDGLLAWVATRWKDSPPLTLGALAERLNDPDARRALNDMERDLYGPMPGKHDAKLLAVTVRQVKRAVRGNCCALRARFAGLCRSS